MSQDLLEKAKAILQLARKAGAQGARTSVYRSREARVEWRDGKLDRTRENTRLGASVTLLVDGRFSSNSTSDLRPTALERFLAETVAATRYLAPDPHRKLPDPKRYQGRFTGDLGVHDAAGAAASDPMARQRAAKGLEEAARAAGRGVPIVSVTGSASESVSERVLMTSNGMEGSHRSTGFGLSAVVSVRDEGARKPAGWWYAWSRRRAALPPVESIGQEAMRRTLLQRGAQPDRSGKYACVIENAVASQLLGWLLDPLWGQPIQQQRSFLADRLGQTVGSPALSLVDDPLLPGGLASEPFDGEGMTSVKRTIFEQGVLRSFYLDTYYASKLGQEPTTGSSTNLVLLQGTRSLEALLTELGDGILVTGFSGGNSNLATGDFSVGIRGLRIQGGKVVRPVTEMNLAGNHLTFWKQLAEVGSDPFLYDSARTPSLRFTEVQFSGRDR